jgi:hypothetical protein
MACLSQSEVPSTHSDSHRNERHCTRLARPSRNRLVSARLQGEARRTCGQPVCSLLNRGRLRLDARIDHANLNETGAQTDVRSSPAAGPVAVFSSSNFPFAFSIAGGDTHQPGCRLPVIVKPHQDTWAPLKPSVCLSNRLPGTGAGRRLSLLFGLP